MSKIGLAKPVKGKLVPGQLVELFHDSDLHRVLTRAKLEPFLIYPTKRVLTSLIADFYNNLTLNPGPSGTVFLTSIVNDIPCLVDQEVFVKALNLHPTLYAFDHIDISKTFVFERNEYRNLISLLWCRGAS